MFDKALDALGTLRIQCIQHLDLMIGPDTLHMLQCIDWLNCEQLVVKTEGLALSQCQHGD